MPRFVQSQSAPGMVTYLNEDGTPAFDMPEDAALSMGYSVEPPEVPAAVALDIPSSPEVPVMQPGDVVVPQDPTVNPQAGLPVAPVAQGGPMPTPSFDQPVTAPPPPTSPPTTSDAVSSPEAGGSSSSVAPEDMSPYAQQRHGFEMERRGLDEEAKAQAEAAEALAAGQREAAAMEAADAAANKKAELEYAQRTQNRMSALDNRVQELSARKIDPENFWKTRSDGQRVAGVISMVLGGFMEPVTGKNSGAEMINRAIEQDLDAQRANLMKDMELLGHDRALVHDRINAERAALDQQYVNQKMARDAVISKANAAAAGTHSRQIWANHAKLVGKLHQDDAKMRLGFEQYYAELDALEAKARAAGAPKPGKYNPGDLPEGVSEERAIYKDGRAVAYVRQGKDTEASKVVEQFTAYENLDRRVSELEAMREEIAADTGVPLTTAKWWTNNKVAGHPKYRLLRQAYELIRTGELKAVSGSAVTPQEAARWEGMMPEWESFMETDPSAAWNRFQRDRREEIRTTFDRRGVVRIERGEDGSLGYGGTYDPTTDARNTEARIKDQKKGGTTSTPNPRGGLDAQEPSVQVESGQAIVAGWRSWAKNKDAGFPRGSAGPQADAAAMRQRAKAARSMLETRDDLTPEQRAEYESVAETYDRYANELDWIYKEAVESRRIKTEPKK